MHAQQRAVLVGVGQDADFPQLLGMGGRGSGEVLLEGQFQDRQEQPFSQRGVLERENLYLVLRGPEDVVVLLRAGLDPIEVDGYEDGEGLDGVDEPGAMEPRTGGGQAVRGEDDVERKEDKQVVEVGRVQIADNAQDFFEVGVDAEGLHVHGYEVQVELVEDGVDVEHDARLAAEQGTDVRPGARFED